MAQGTRVSCNLMYRNDLEDLFMEVNHGPTLVDNNLFLSDVAIITQSQGGAVEHNIIAGMIRMWPEPNRYTPYHLPHSTEVAGISTIFSGDYRFHNNIFLGIGPMPTKRDPLYKYGLEGFNTAVLQVWIGGNVYYNMAVPYKDEKNSYRNQNFKPSVEIAEEGDNVYLTYTLDGKSGDAKTQFITTALLGTAKMPKEGFENPDGTPLKIDRDFLGQKRSETAPSAGAIENPGSGAVKMKVW
jgi:hypothetical protein